MSRPTVTTVDEQVRVMIDWFQKFGERRQSAAVMEVTEMSIKRRRRLFKNLCDAGCITWSGQRWVATKSVTQAAQEMADTAAKEQR